MILSHIMLSHSPSLPPSSHTCVAGKRLAGKRMPAVSKQVLCSHIMLAPQQKTSRRVASRGKKT